MYQEEKTRADDDLRQAGVILALRTSRSCYQAVIEAVGDLVYTHAADGVLTAINPAFEIVLGWKAADWLGQQFTMLVHPDELAVAVEQIESCLRGESVPPVEFRVRTSRGDYRLLEFRYALDGRAGAPQSVIGIARDVTERRWLESQQRLLEGRYARVQKLESLAALATGVANDFNNALTAILGHAEIALAGLPSASPVRDNIGHIQAAARRAEELTRQLHLFAGEGESVVEPLSLSDMVREIEQLVRNAVPKTQTLVLQLAPGLPLVDVDPLLLPQVILNLITNASEAIGEQPGVIMIRTGLRTLDAEFLASSHIGGELPPGEYVAIEVGDTGGGMTDDSLARIFDPFFTTKDKSLGLGLATVHGIAKDHGAVIHATSVLGRGSTFSISFHPSAETPRTRAEPPLSPDAVLRGTGVILVVDNEEPIRRLARIVLEHAGFTVLTANDGVEAIEVFQQHASTIRAVVLDLTMPRMDGVTALRELQRLREDLPVVLSSGFIAQKAARDLTAGKLVGFTQKPYHSRELVEAVCRAVAGRTSGHLER